MSFEKFEQGTIDWLFTGVNRWAEPEENRRAQKLTSHDRQHGPDMDEDEF